MKKYNLEEICNRFLDDTYMLIDVSKLPEITFVFDIFKQVDNRYWKVTFICDDLVDIKTDTYNLLEIIRDAHNILHTRVEVSSENDSDSLYKINLEGGVNFSISCKKFIWKYIEISEDEYNNLYFHT